MARKNLGGEVPPIDAARVRRWAQECRELAEPTVVPDVTRALDKLAEDMEDAAQDAERR